MIIRYLDPCGYLRKPPVSVQGGPASFAFRTSSLDLSEAFSKAPWCLVGNEGMDYGL